MEKTPGPSAVSICLASLVFCIHAERSAFGQQIISGAQARNVARERGLVTSGTTVENRVFSLQAFYDGMPMYYQTDNATAAISVSTSKCYLGGGGGLSLSGSGVTLGIWDGGGVRTGHVEFGGRADQQDSPGSTHYHATHVAGTMIASGVVPSAKGMSPEAMLDCYDWDFDKIEMNAAARNGLRASNHSYGFITGWLRISFFGGGVDPIDPFKRRITDPMGGIPITEWAWFGDTRVSQFEDHFFGYYSFEALAWDELIFDNPSYLWVNAAGNDRNEGPSGAVPHIYYNRATNDWVFSDVARSKDGNSGYDSISHASCGKNGLTVGAVNDVSGGYNAPQGVLMSSFSCWGPADDGRIKPDIVGNGIGLYSTFDTSNNAYAILTGTSMASPNVCGSLGLLIQRFRNTHPNDDDMLASTLKGLVIHTADECGPAQGPDYQFGWGLLNTLKAAQLITADVNQPNSITEHTLLPNETVEFVVISDPAAGGLRATICWTDPPPTVEIPFALDPSTQVLVNDLDLRIVGAAQTYEPWVLDRTEPGLPAARGDNNVDNVEQVVVQSNVADAYHITVTPSGPLVGGSQVFSLLISGASLITQQTEEVPPILAAERPVRNSGLGTVPTVEVTFDEPVFGVQPGHLLVNGAPATAVEGSGIGPYTFAGFTVPTDGLVQVEVVGGAIEDIFENAFAGANWSYMKLDCNDNGTYDPQDAASGFSFDCNRNSIPDECDPAALKTTPAADAESIAFSELLTMGDRLIVSGGVPPFTYAWTLRGDATEEHSDLPNPAFHPSEPGTYVARIVVTDAIGCRSISYVTVRVTEADLAAGPLSGGVGAVVTGFCPMLGGMTLLLTVVGCLGMRVARSRGRRRLSADRTR